MTRYVNRDTVIPPGSVVVPEWLFNDLVQTMTRAMLSHQVVARTFPDEISAGAKAWGSRMGESTICAAYLRCALDQLQALKEQQE